MPETSSDLTKLMVLIEANTKAYENAMKKIMTSTDGAMGAAAKSGKVVDFTLRQIETGAGRAGASIRKMEAELAAAAAASVMPMQLSNQQLAQMQFQIQDLGVQLASGQSPFMAIMQQGSQIAQMFGPGSTVLGALKATGAGILAFITNPINLAVVGFAAASAAAPAIWQALTGPEAKKAEDLLRNVDDLLGELEKGYGSAAAAARQFIDAATSGDQLSAMFARTESQLRAGLSKAIDELVPKTIGFTKTFGDFGPEVKRAQAEIEALGRQLQAGEITAKQFADEIADIRLAENTPDEIKVVADRLLEATAEAQKLEAALLGVTAAAESTRKAIAIDPARFDQDAKSRQETMAEVAAKLRSQAASIAGPRTTSGSSRRAAENPWRGFGIEDETINSAAALREQMELLQAPTKALREDFKSLASGIVDGFRRGASALDILNNSLNNVLSKLLDNALNSIIASMFPMPSADPWAGMRIAGARAMGGPVSPGRPYMVGERGPELFIPSTAGTVASKATGSAPVNVQVINNNGSQVSTQGRGTMADPLRIVVDAVKGDMAKGGFDQAMSGRYGARPQARSR